MNKKTKMNKKGVTGMILVLILGSIAIAMIFTGGLYAFRSVACYMGINWTDFDIGSAFSPHPGAARDSKIFLAVDFTPVNYTTCLNRCYAPNDSCIDFCGADSGSVTDCLELCNDCVDNCLNQFPYGLDLEYTEWLITITYRGSLASIVSVVAQEEYDDGRPPQVFLQTATEGVLVPGQTYVMAINSVRTENCDANVYFTATSATTGVIGTRSEVFELDFCSHAPPRDVNITVHNVTLDTTAKKVLVGAEISGSDVAELCPKAAILVKMNTLDGKGQTHLPNCVMQLDSERPEWFNSSWQKRLVFEMVNDVGEDATNEVVEALLDFSPDTIQNCQEVVITDEDNNVANRTFFPAITPNKCLFYFNASISAGVSKTYYAYYQNKNSTEWQPNWTSLDYSDYLPTYTIDDFNFERSSSENCTYVDGDIKITFGACVP